MARIIVTTSSGEQTVELPAGQVVTIGRDESNRLPLGKEAGVSRRHCRIGPREDGEAGWEVTDLGSTNGTRVGGTTVRSKVLVHGDEVEVGSVHLRFEDPEEAAHLEKLSKDGVCYLQWVAGDRKGEKLMLEAKRVTIGRRDTNTLPLDDRMVSGHHAEIDRDLNGYTVRDLGSTNGTLLNGEPISEALLTHGGRLRIGNSRFVFKDPSMKDIEVALDTIEEDEGWGMMGEIDLSRSRTSKSGIFALIMLFLAAAAGGWWLNEQASKGETEGVTVERNFVENGDFDEEDYFWTADREGAVELERRETGGSPGPWLQVANAEEEDGQPRLVLSDDAAEASGARPLAFNAKVKGSDVELVLVWTNDLTRKEILNGMQPLERTDVIGRSSGGWKAVDTVRVSPAWSRSVRIGVRVPPARKGGIDAVGIRPADADGRTRLPVKTMRSAAMDGHASLDLQWQATVLLTDVRPVARVGEEGTVLTKFMGSGPIEADETSMTLAGVFVGPEEDHPATVRWTTTEEGLRGEITCEGATAVGFMAQAPARSVGSTVSVLGEFPARRLAVASEAALAKVSRTLVGDPSTQLLLAFVQDEHQPVATLQFLPRRDAALVRFVHWVAGPQAAMDIVTDFSRQRKQADDDLKQAKAVVAKAPGRAIEVLRDVAQAYPFEEKIRDEALKLASDIEVKAQQDVAALAQSLKEYRIYGSALALASAEEKANALEAQFLGSEGSAGAFEEEIADLIKQVRAERGAFAVERAMPGMARLERLYTLLKNVEGYKPIAALYARAVIGRYGHLRDDAPDIQRRLESAQKELDELQKLEDVQAALPPLPGGP